jgi:hypothetical protein
VLITSNKGNVIQDDAKVTLTATLYHNGNPVKDLKNYTYQWYKNNDILDATTNELELEDVFGKETYAQYRCVINDKQEEEEA